MKKGTKVVMTALCAVLLVVGSIFGTMAYLTSQTVTVKNTFTVGEVNIKLDEARVDLYGNFLDSNGSSVNTESSAARVNGNEYKLIPGHTYNKVPAVTVLANSEPCYVFVKVENGLGTDATLTINNAWTQLSDGSNIYYYAKVETSATNQKLTSVFDKFTFSGTANMSNYYTNDSSKVVESNGSDVLKSISVTAYAVQADNFASASAAWTATFGNNSSSNP